MSFQSKSCLIIILVLWDAEDNYFTREAEIIIDIVYDLDKDWFRILTLTFTKLYYLNVKLLFYMFL